MHNLTQRQIDILRTLIEEYIDTAEPVGSSNLEKKHNLGVSPATIRNEMAELVQAGYLKQPHTSAGRIPTSKGLKLYIKDLMKPEEISVAEEVILKEKIWDVRHQIYDLMRVATRALSEQTQTLSLATDGQNIYYAGTGHILSMPEFYDIDVTRNLLMLLDEFDYWDKFFSKIGGEEPIHVILGSDLSEANESPYSFVFANIKFNKGKGYIGVIGPKRLPYRKIVPTVTCCAKMLEEVSVW